MIVKYVKVRKWLVWPLSYIGEYVQGAWRVTDKLILKYGFDER